MVDREIFSRRLEALHGYLGKLKAFLDTDEEEFVREPALHDLAERYLHLAVEACLDLANHWISDRALPTPDANRDTFTILERASELSPDLAEKLRGWAGFRNVLVYEYGARRGELVGEPEAPRADGVTMAIASDNRLGPYQIADPTGASGGVTPRASWLV